MAELIDAQVVVTVAAGNGALEANRRAVDTVLGLWLKTLDYKLEGGLFQESRLNTLP